MQSENRSFFRRVRETLLGKPISNKHAAHERLSPAVGLAVFASDALSSVAYATEAILGVLMLIAVSQHSDPLGLQFPISIAVVGLIAVIAFSYRQTIRAYPQGGGSYIVASDNLGPKVGVVAGAALVIDYILTVAVSISAGVAAIVSAFPHLHTYLVPASLFFIVAIGWANLRGMKESGSLFSIPTYGFVICMATMIGFGIFRSMTSAPVPQEIITEPGLRGADHHHTLLFMVLRAFAAGCTALTGIEAVSDGVQAFRPPEQKNASNTLVRMSLILSALFLGMGYIAQHLPVIELFKTKNPEYSTLASQVAAYAFGSSTHPMFYAVQFFTAAILLLAANTAFADFPRVCSFLARDGFLPRYMARLGDRLVFHNGIIVLIVSAMILVYVFHGELDQLLPLYAIGVFTAFSLSQAGMVKHWYVNRESGWQRSLVINAFGLTLCVIVGLIILITKFTEGAWIVAILMPALCFLLLWIRKRYSDVSSQMALKSEEVAEITRHVVLILVPRVHQGVLNALEYAQQLKGDVQAVHITLNEKTLPELARQWDRLGDGVPLVVLPSQFRSLTEPLADYVDTLRAEDPGTMITVVVAEAVSSKWYQKLLSENVAQQIKQAMGRRRNVTVANVRYFID